ncbi:MAG TPA: hypothetical protein VKC58_07515 [Myxococcales bacterium]|nr:hypothetical protein [Myxococcales bacterium]
MTEFLVEFFLSRTDPAAIDRSVRRARLAWTESPGRSPAQPGGSGAILTVEKEKLVYFGRGSK